MKYLNNVSAINGFTFKYCYIDNNILIPVDDRPDLGYLNRHVTELLCASGTETWEDLGVLLLGDESTGALDKIKTDDREVTKCCNNMFRLWLERQPTASWRKLLQALRQLKLDHLASQIELGLIIPGLLLI